MLYLITGDSQYISELTRRQRNDGSWDNNNFNTALAVLALKKSSGETNKIDNATAYLIKKQQSDGSWGNVQDTAMILYSAFSDTSISLENVQSCSDGIKNGDEEGVDCGGSCSKKCVCNFDGVCDSDIGEDSKQCPSDCKESAGPCNFDGVCDAVDGETRTTCPDDCPSKTEEEAEVKCGDGTCDASEDSSSCPQDCEKKKSSLVWWVLIIIVLAIVVFLIYYYRKIGKKKSKTFEFGFGGAEKKLGSFAGSTKKPTDIDE
ncbi:hypothetical protein HYX19_00935, partial [Candidatus Woesearchaeota archaeon]|nr:hypothetical protein [Candidatus Woesearchaeota archaeon]